ncbi:MULTISPECIES: TetR/AcrR family transcriptional regulator [Paenibacillus]|uniref:TetR family transcriptional regulator n=1 Tax=Paenibacillus pabuli TaxID=1472 RepID=A0ABX9BCH9_9BACL|nr:MULTISPECIES: TetR/AcrR family transcriptional regulator [Paenibacillus]RAI85878.1 TetR family transcriptional regulator [Paenibacillus pabuli]SEN58362.1 transcriptional regulator, TetR family [Paenibacillus sp. OK076]
MNENWHQQIKNQHRDDLIEAGKELFLKYGLLQVKIKDVCTKAELSRVTFYKHFQSMDELLLTVQMQLVEKLTDHVRHAAIPNENGREQLAAMLNAWVHFAQNHPDHIRFIQLFDINYEVYDFHPELREVYDRFTHNGKENHFLLGALTTGIADGSIQNPSPPLKLAQFIFTVMMGMLQKMVTSRSNDLYPPDDQMTEQLVHMLLHYACNEDQR